MKHVGTPKPQKQAPAEPVKPAEPKQPAAKKPARKPKAAK